MYLQPVALCKFWLLVQHQCYCLICSNNCKSTQHLQQSFINGSTVESIAIVMNTKHRHINWNSLLGDIYNNAY